MTWQIEKTSRNLEFLWTASTSCTSSAGPPHRRPASDNLRFSDRPVAQSTSKAGRTFHDCATSLCRADLAFVSVRNGVESTQALSRSPHCLWRYDRSQETQVRKRDRISYGVVDPAAFTVISGLSIDETLMRHVVAFRRADNTRRSTDKRAGGWDQLRQRLKGDDEGRPFIYFSTIAET